MGVTFPNESPEYRAARSKLLQREATLRHEMEAMAAEIRALPPGGFPRITNSIILNAKGAPAKVRLSELFRLVPIPISFSWDQLLSSSVDHCSSRRRSEND